MTAAQRRRSPPRWLLLVAGMVLRVLALTWRYRVEGAERVRAVRQAGQPVVFAFWHGHMLPLLWYHRREGVVVLASEHGDGELIARVAARLGYGAVRGSTTRGGGRALLGLIRAARDGHDIAVAPDGPRGPAEVFAPGAVVVAQRSRAPLVLVAAGAASAWRLRSWDRFLVPKPFARVTVRYADPQVVRAGSLRDASEQVPQFQEQLRRLSARSDA
jgi:lysophospholipid acyltransferase (LPLAT)-like uncharacterized protein